MARLKAAPSLLPSLRPGLKPPEKLADPFYLSPEWRALASAMKRLRGYACEECGDDMTERRRMLIADHVIEIRDGGSKLDPLNVRVLCIGCHNRKTARAKADRWR